MELVGHLHYAWRPMLDSIFVAFGRRDARLPLLWLKHRLALKYPTSMRCSRFSVTHWALTTMRYITDRC